MKKWFQSISRLRKLQKEAAQAVKLSMHSELEDFINRWMRENPKYQDSKKLNRFERQHHSQNGEDGVIEEIFRRIGTTNKYFVEFGASSDGLENNTVSLLYDGWQGFWLEPSEKNVARIKNKFDSVVKQGRLRVKDAFVTAENVEELFRSAGVPVDMDLLSIDIDGNDYWVWKALESYRPRALVIEYNAVHGAFRKWVMAYNADHVWDGSDYYGASLKSLELLGTKKGYALVGCDFTGLNAFFVRTDLVGGHFQKPFTSENHYEPPRYFLTRKTGQATRNFGPFEGI
jgi:hypothetical protein